MFRVPGLSCSKAGTSSGSGVSFSLGGSAGFCVLCDVGSISGDFLQDLLIHFFLFFLILSCWCLLI